MANGNKPYIEKKPGDLWTAEIWNEAQVMIKEDVESTAKALKDEIEKKGVSSAENASKFGEKTPAEWEMSFDSKYAPKTHSHDEMGGYLRCFKTFNKTENTFLIEHGFHSYPLVDVWELNDIGVQLQIGMPPRTPINFLAYHKDETFNWAKEIPTRKKENPIGPGGVIILTDEPITNRGYPLTDVLKEFQIRYSVDDTFNDVVQKLKNALNSGQNQIGNFFSSNKVTKLKDLKIRELKSTGDLDRIMFYFEAIKRVPTDMELLYLNFDTLLVTVDSSEEFRRDYMFLLRT